MSLRKKLNIICIVLAALLVVVIFLPSVSFEINNEEFTNNYWDNLGEDHLEGIVYILEFLGAFTIYLLYQFDKMKDNKLALLFLGQFLFGNFLILFKLINDEVVDRTFTYGYWIGLIFIVALVTINIIINYVKDNGKQMRYPNNRYNNGYNQMPPYNMYNQPYGQPQGPMGYNNYR